MTSMGYVQAVLGGIGAVSLLVAAIGIANTMMMSIYERTKEIGVMKVLGCSLENIRTMFLIEAGVIGFVGGVVGVALSYGVSAIINYISAGSDILGMVQDPRVACFFVGGFRHHHSDDSRIRSFAEGHETFASGCHQK